MRRIIKDTKGAVTVFVTLLLIPAMLVSGTAVDLVRIHTARSIVQDANQLAANAVLTQYDALLKDLYGVMGVAKDDPILADLLDDYIKVTVFGEERQDRKLGTLQVFYGSNISMEDLYFPDGKNLRDESVLRRQIEEYMKFRGPVLLVKEFIESLTDNKIKEDAERIKEKLEIENAIAEIYEKYKELYNAIIAADKCDQVGGGITGGTVGTVSSTLKIIWNQFQALIGCSEAWESVDMELDGAEERKSDYAARYRAILENIRAYTVGGQTGSDWSDGRWNRKGSSQGLNKTIENAKNHADNWKPKFDAVVGIAREIDAMRDELNKKIDEFERRLNSGECSPEIKLAFTERTGTPPKSIIERYRDILKWSIEPMAKAYKDGGDSYIDDKVKPLLDSVRYRNADRPSAASLSREELANITSDGRFSISSGARDSLAAALTMFPAEKVSYEVPAGFLKFSEHPGDNGPFFNELSEMVKQKDLPPVKLYEEQEDAKDGDGEKKQRDTNNNLLELVNKAYIGLTNSPLGAMQLCDDETPDVERLNILEIFSEIPNALSLPVLRVIQDPLGATAGMGDYILLLTYCTSMFSNYTTTKPESVGKTRDDLGEITFTKSITGVQISPDVNYFFQSEWEYLYNGSENAGKNLSAITGLVFMLRFVCNYIRVFSVTEITSIVTSIRSAFSWSPPLGIILGELARAAFVAAETLVDVAALRTGHKVPLLKDIAKREWVCSPRGLLKALTDVVAGDVVDESKFKNEKGLTYSHYMLFLFLGKAIVYLGSESDAATELAERTGNLIEWNVINYKSGSKADEEKMAEALASQSRFRLEDMKTDFRITTTVDMSMLFLSMAFAQKFSDTRGIGMPKTMPVTVTDHRGY